MICAHCTHDAGSAKFCPECGQPLVRTCAQCHAPLTADAKFCGGCGIALTADRATAPTRPPATSPPKHLAEKILTSRSALEGERKQVTVLFADVKGSMELAERPRRGTDLCG